MHVKRHGVHPHLELSTHDTPADIGVPRLDRPGADRFETVVVQIDMVVGWPTAPKGIECYVRDVGEPLRACDVALQASMLAEDLHRQTEIVVLEQTAGDREREEIQRLDSVDRNGRRVTDSGDEIARQTQ